MGLRAIAANFLAVRRTAAVLEKLLLKHRRDSYAFDLADDPEDPTKADPVMAAAVMKLLKKYGEQLVLSRFRGRCSLSWRTAIDGSTNKETREQLNAVGFYVGADATLDEIRSGVDPMQVGDPRTAQKRVDENRRTRIRQWARRGWQGNPDWAPWGGDPDSVRALPEYAEWAAEELAKQGKTNIGGVDIKIVTPEGS